MMEQSEESIELIAREVENSKQIYYSKDGVEWFSSLSGMRLDDAECDEYLHKHLSYAEFCEITKTESQSDLYIAEYDAVDSKRRALYTQMSDPLYFEAYRSKDDGDISKYEDFKAQADAAVDKIKSENPWPINPEA